MSSVGGFDWYSHVFVLIVCGVAFIWAAVRFIKALMKDYRDTVIRQFFIDNPDSIAVFLFGEIRLRFEYEIQWPRHDGSGGYAPGKPLYGGYQPKPTNNVPNNPESAPIPPKDE